MSRWQVALLSLALCLVGLGTFIYKVGFLGFPIRADQTVPIWTVEVGVSFLAGNDPAKLKLFIPKSSSRMVILDENFVSKGFGLTSQIEEGNRRAEWSIRKAQGRNKLFYRAVIRAFDTAASSSTSKPPEYEDPGFSEAERAAAETILKDVVDRSADRESLVRNLHARFNQADSQTEIDLLLGKDRSLSAKLGAIVRVLALNQIPARSVHGIALEHDTDDAAILHWLEVHDDKSWVTFDPETGKGVNQRDLVTWWRGSEPLVSASGVAQLSSKISVSRAEEQAIAGALEQGRSSEPLLLRLSFFDLPLQSQAVIKVMLLIPIGAVLVVIFRNLIGLQTFGTFMPVLVALAFRETQIINGVIFFTVIVAIGLAIRFYLEKLKLLLVPRLAAVLTVVVLLLCFLSLMSHKIGLQSGLSIAFFPMVIMTMTIERMSVLWEEVGAAQAIKQGVGSLIVAALATLVMGISFLEHLLFVFPELLLVVLALCLALGRYSGYRLSEIFRFKQLVS